MEPKDLTALGGEIKEFTEVASRRMRGRCSLASHRTTDDGTARGAGEFRRWH